MATEPSALPAAAARPARSTRTGWSLSAERLREHVTSAGLTTAAFVLVAAIAQADGGYFPVTWGWSTIALAWAGAIALIAGPELRLGRLELAFVAMVGLTTAWIGLSIVWSSDVDASVLELQRALVYLAGAFAALALMRRATIAPLLAGALAAIVWVSAHALATRLFPGLSEGVQEVNPGRLAEPIGYWNALGLFAVIGVLLALAFAAHARRPSGRVLAGAALPILLTTAYFTYSRGAVLALAVGLAAAIAFDGRRLPMAALAALLALPSGIAVWIASRAPALNSVTAAPGDVAREGGELAVVVLVTAIASGALVYAVSALEPRLRRRASRRPRLAGGPGRRRAVLVACVLLAVTGAAAIALGGPAALSRAAGDAFAAEAPRATGDAGALSDRLGSVGNGARIDHWRVALGERAEHPWLGSGAGTFEQFWVRDRPVNDPARDAHSLYVESLAELGGVGLALVLGVLLLPFAAARRARGQPLAAGAFGVCAAFFVHAGLDWDWEMPIVTLLALLCAVAVLAARADDSPTGRVIGGRWRALGVAAAVGLVVVSAVGIAGNRSLAAAGERLDGGGDARAAEADARRALRWAPWSAQARRRLGQAQVQQGRTREGRANLRRAATTTPTDWRIWYDLGLAAGGSERRRALARAAALNPLGDDIVALREQRQRRARTREAR